MASHGDAASIGAAIVQRARETRADLIALASHHSSAARKVLLGSVSRTCINKATGVPCMVIKPPPAGAPAR